MGGFVAIRIIGGLDVHYTANKSQGYVETGSNCSCEKNSCKKSCKKSCRKSCQRVRVRVRTGQGQGHVGCGDFQSLEFQHRILDAATVHTKARTRNPHGFALRRGQRFNTFYDAKKI